MLPEKWADSQDSSHPAMKHVGGNGFCLLTKTQIVYANVFILAYQIMVTCRPSCSNNKMQRNAQ